MPVFYTLAMRKLSFLLLLLLVTAVVSAQERKVVVATDEKTQITVPAHWDKLELNDAAEIEVGNPGDEAYLIVLNEAKEDLYGWNLEKHSRVTMGKLLAGMTFPTISAPKAITIRKSPAVQYEIRGAVDNLNLVYIHTTVDGPKYFSQILAWTLSSKADTIKPQLLEAINTFREVQ